MRLLFTICGRAGSKGIKNKNIRDFLGKPLPLYTLSAIDLFAKNTDMVMEYDIALNTDSNELMEIVCNYPGMMVHKIERKEELAGDVVGKVDVIRDTVLSMQNNLGYSYDYVIDLDITSPLRKIDDLENVLRTHIDKKADVTTTIASARRNPYFNQVMKTEHGYKKVIDGAFTSRQQAPSVFDMNASIYVYSIDHLLSGGGVLDGYCECVEMYDTAVLDLDHENDFELMEVVADYLYKKDIAFRRIYENIH